VRFAAPEPLDRGFADLRKMSQRSW
jgi:hypothetical protein